MVIGNGVATIVVAKWNGELDQAKLDAALGGEVVEYDTEVAVADSRATV